ncbi:GlyGly-CTERM sorting domain-containing protein [Oceanobacter sp. 5_MG-2023]|uniref:choice-of-anchor tandem repeat GloVer-containing protein n=1 Tax=Oceanobacter sp. 5_MG-2023 TaxID=3062645 RepID=UPI0026E418FC|nr:choice-of-anchor tandem repeat GloVer-containing protein [Oceanobacter sp. 5_MG-2023]MDO6682453.1 GlyGly-CTERM sorting domain-containing protein [Oceanobacter sp. 5_MG-2023]
MFSKRIISTLLLTGISFSLQAAPSVERIYSTDQTDIVLTKFIYGSDGRLYGKYIDGSSSPSVLSILSMEPDGSDPQLDEVDFYYEATTLVSNHRGQIFLGHSAETRCPEVLREIQGSSEITGRVYGSITKYTPWAEEASERMVDMTTNLGAAICPTGNMVLDNDDNLYFISKAEGDTEIEAVNRIYRLSAEGELEVIKEVVVDAEGDNEATAFAEGYEPVNLFIDADGQTIYGINTEGGNKSFESGGTTFRVGTIFKIDTANNNDYSVLRQAYILEDPGLDSGAWLTTINDKLYYITDGHPVVDGGDGILNSLDLSSGDADTIDASWFKVVDFNGTSSPMGNSPRTLQLGMDGMIYGVTGKGGSNVTTNANGEGTLYRLDPVTDIFETLYEFSSDNDVKAFPVGLSPVSPDGNFFGSTTASSSTVFKVDTDIIPTSPVITAFWTETPELTWESGALQATLNWNVTNPSGELSDVTCSASGDWDEAISELTDASQTVVIANEGTNEFVLTCDNGTEQSSQTLRVLASGLPDPVSIIDFRSDLYEVEQGETFTINWQTENAASCDTNWGTLDTEQAVSGSKEITGVPGEYTYELTCTGLGGDEVSATPLDITVEISESVDAGSSSGGAFNPLLLLPAALLLFRRRRVTSAS